MYSFKGKIVRVGNEQQVSDKFRKREFDVINDSNQYPETCRFQVVNDKCSMLDGLEKGDEVDVTFGLRGREWTDPKTNEIRVFNTLECYKIQETI